MCVCANKNSFLRYRNTLRTACSTSNQWWNQNKTFFHMSVCLLTILQLNYRSSSCQICTKAGRSQTKRHLEPIQILDLQAAWISLVKVHLTHIFGRISAEKRSVLSMEMQHPIGIWAGYGNIWQVFTLSIQSLNSLWSSTQQIAYLLIIRDKAMTKKSK